MNEENENDSDNWTISDFYAWLVEEAFHFRNWQERFSPMENDNIKTSAEWGAEFKEWLEDNI